MQADCRINLAKSSSCHRLCILACIDQLATIRLSLCDCDQTLPDAIVKFRTHFLETRFGRGRAEPLHGALQTQARITIQNEGQMRVKSDHAVMQGINKGAAGGSSCALDGARGVDEAIADDDRAARQGRENGLFKMIPPCRREKQDLGFSRPAAWLSFDKKAANIFRARRPAGLPGVDDIETARLEVLNDTACAAGFSAAFNAFKGNEHRGSFVEEDEPG